MFGDETFSRLDTLLALVWSCLIKFERRQTFWYNILLVWTVIKHVWYRLATQYDISKYGHQTMLDNVWSPSIFPLDRDYIRDKLPDGLLVWDGSQKAHVDLPQKLTWFWFYQGSDMSVRIFLQYDSLFSYFSFSIYKKGKNDFLQLSSITDTATSIAKWYNFKIAN